jgi:hypothetical protein
MAFAYKQYTLYGYVSSGMILVNLFHLIYVFDGQFNEKSILTTMDITTEVPFSFFIFTFHSFIFSSYFLHIFFTPPPSPSPSTLPPLLLLLVHFLFKE